MKLINEHPHNRKRLVIVEECEHLFSKTYHRSLLIQQLRTMATVGLYVGGRRRSRAIIQNESSAVNSADGNIKIKLLAIGLKIPEENLLMEGRKRIEEESEDTIGILRIKYVLLL